MDDAAPLKEAIAAVLASPDADGPAEALNTLVDALLPRVIRGLVPLRIVGAPLGMSEADIRQLTGLEGSQVLLEGPAAAGVVRRVDGMRLGGSRLQVEVDLPSGRVLPTVPRGQRGDNPRGRPAPWLTHRDEEGRWSLTPQHIARRQAQAAMGSVIIDVGCGCGGNSVAFAEAGFDVIAIEPDPERRRLADANFRARRVTGSVRLWDGTAADRLADALETEPHAAVFIDPPWGGEDWPRRTMSWDELIEPLGVSTSLLRAGAQLLVKAPRTLDVTTLPRPGAWDIRYEFGEHSDDARVVKCITAAAWSASVRAFEMI